MVRVPVLLLGTITHSLSTSRMGQSLRNLAFCQPQFGLVPSELRIRGCWFGNPNMPFAEGC